MPVSSKLDPELLKNIVHLPESEQRQVLDLIDQLNEVEKKEEAQQSFMGFV